MNKNSYKVKINKIRNIFKKDLCFLELSLINYEGFNIYIRIDYVKKLNVYKLRWYDLDIIDYEKLRYYVCEELILPSYIDNIATLTKSIKSNKNVKVKNEGLVELNINTPALDNKFLSYKFNYYIPVKDVVICNIIDIIFMNLPTKLNSFLVELKALINNITDKYEYKRKFKFDLEKDDINKLFVSDVLDTSKVKNRILYLEKIFNTYYAVVQSDDLYVITINEDNLNKELRMNCSCKQDSYCKHIYLVLTAIKEKNFKPFYKVSYVNNSDSIFDKISKFNYFLCLGVYDDKIVLLNQDNQIEYVKLEEKNGYSFKIIEDDEDGTLSKKLNGIKL